MITSKRQTDNTHYVHWWSVRLVVSQSDTSTKTRPGGGTSGRRDFRLSGPGRFGCGFPSYSSYVFRFLRSFIKINTNKMLSLDFLDDVRRMNKRQVGGRLRGVLPPLWIASLWCQTGTRSYMLTLLAAAQTHVALQRCTHCVCLLCVPAHCCVCCVSIVCPCTHSIVYTCTHSTVCLLCVCSACTCTHYSLSIVCTYTLYCMYLHTLLCVFAHTTVCKLKSDCIV